MKDNEKSIKKGDLVEVIDEPVKGEVVEVKGSEVVIRTSEGFDLAFRSTELIVVNSMGLNAMQRVPMEAISQKKQGSKKRKPPKPVATSRKKRKSIPPLEVDLHIGQLVRSTKGMTNHEMRTLQLDTAKRQLDFAIAKRIPKVVFIHGVGDGVLKADLDSLLRRYDDKVTFHDADYKKYGRGATEVRIFQNPKTD